MATLNKAGRPCTASLECYEQQISELKPEIEALVIRRKELQAEFQDKPKKLARVMRKLDVALQATRHRKYKLNEYKRRLVVRRWSREPAITE